ncbi:MAG: nucleotidyl transferase AbiEii/AbiGii toxin family protein [Candidatus Taylorbacteria bacterium]|nr:nucleotidyl transferase AbiEii/AbiGii toxin family protein [Candidatus Taylorbacteria bacterium]
MQSILSENQKKILNLLSGEKDIFSNFYLGGGTALAEFYLKHRLSEDLDFFSENEFDPLSISVILKKMQDIMGIKKVEYTNSFNRNLFFLDLEDGDKIKTEFTFFPFPRIDKKNKIGSLSIDSMQDIAVNKIFTIYQNPRSRDFIDLYFILQKEKDWFLDDLIKNAQVKFDTYLDPIQLGTQYMKVKELKDYPKMIIKIDGEVWQDFFINEAKKLKSKIIE